MPNASVKAYPVTGDQLIWTGRARYCGFSLRETAGSTAVVRIYDNTTNSGTIIDTIALAPGESAREFYPDDDGTGGIQAITGIYCKVVSGTIEGSVRWAS